MPEEVISTNKTSLFTLKGLIVIHYLDGERIEGLFAAQDAYNIFLNVNGEPVMIPRHQIRMIKGLHGQPIEPDTAPEFPAGEKQRELTQTAMPKSVVTTQPLPSKLDFPPLSAPPPEEELPSLPETEPVEEEDDKDDGTLILVADMAAEEEEDEDDKDDGTVILDSSDEILSAAMPDTDEDDELDMTVVLGDAGLLDEFDAEDEEEEGTIALRLDMEQEPALALTCVGGPHAGEIYKLTGGITTIGRSSDNGLVLSSDKEISRHHAIVLHESGQYVVQDQNSLNGTFVNDEPVTAPRYLELGDEILVGVSVLKYDEA